MKDALEARELLWAERQRVLTAETRRERGVWLKRFFLVLVLIIATVAVAIALANRNI